MKQIAKQVSLLVASVMMVLGLAVVPVSAEHGSGGGGTGDDNSGSGSVTTHLAAETEAETDTSNGGDNGGKLRDQVKELLKTERQKGKEHTHAERQKSCEQRQKSIDNRTSNYAAAAQRHLDTFNSIFTKLQAFHDNKGLNVTDYDALVAAATAKQAAAQSAVDALKALDVQIDCTQSDPASAVATIKTAVSDARTALKDYRTSLKDLVVALKGASTAQSDNSTDTTEDTGGDQ